MVGEVIQSSVDVDMGSWIDQRTRAALNFGVVPLSIEEQLDLLHIGSPVNFGVLKRAKVSSVSVSIVRIGSLTGHLGDHNHTQGCVQENQRRWYEPGQPMPSCSNILCEPKDLQMWWVTVTGHGVGFWGMMIAHEMVKMIDQKRVV